MADEYHGKTYMHSFELVYWWHMELPHWFIGCVFLKSLGILTT